MASITPQLNEIMAAVYGEEVRSSIVSALQAMNVQADAAADVAGSVNTRITALETDNAANKNDIRDALSAIQGLEAADASIIARLVTDENFRETYQPKIIKAVQDIENQQTQISAVTTQAEHNRLNLAYLVDQINALNAGPRLTNLEARARNTDTALAQFNNDISSVQDTADTALSGVNTLEQAIETLTMTQAAKIDDFEVIDGYLYGLSNGVRMVGPYGPFSGGAGGGGSSANNADLSVQNTSGWNSKTISTGAECIFTLQWSSIEDGNPTGNGTLSVSVNGVAVSTRDISQGTVSVDLTDLLSSGGNNIRMQVTDIYGNSRALAVSVKVLALTVSSNFDASGVFDSAFTFTYTPTGAVTKNVVLLIDGAVAGTQMVNASDRQQSFYIPQQSHGAHTLECYFTAMVDGNLVESNHLTYAITCVTSGAMDPVITINYGQTNVNQYSSIVVPYTVYNPSSLNSSICLEVDGSAVGSLTVDRTEQLWPYRCDTPGSHTLTIRCGSVSKSITLNVIEITVDSVAETNDLQLYLTSYGRSNAESNPASWISQSTPTAHACTFSGFNWVTNGWCTDDDGITVMRVNGDARITIPYKPCASDFRTTGKTIEFEFATRDVRDYDAEIISCWSGNIGFKLTAQEAKLKSSQSEISMQYKDDEHLRISFVVEKRAETRLIFIYVDGIISRAIQYPVNDDFSQSSPVNISIGSSDCTVDLYNIRIYDNNLTKHQMVDGWIADTQGGPLLLDRYTRNAIYDEYSKVVIDRLPKNLPYLIVQGPVLPQFKGDKRIMSGSFTDPANPSRNFTFENAQFDVQGTSSAGYVRKNYKVKFNGGFDTSSGNVSKYPLRPGAIPTKTFTFKADVASSEGANNVELIRLYNDLCPYKTPPQLANEAVRQGIDGFPMVIFWNDGTDTTFLGKYNFNNDKGTEEIYGFASGDESWETLNNTTDRTAFQSWNDSDWSNDFEGRYPDGNTEVSSLRAFVQTVAAWDESTAKQEVEAVSEKNSFLFMYLWMEFGLMVDSGQKNAFPTRFGNGKWVWIPYDADTALGINNEGQLTFTYSLENGDTVDGAQVFNWANHKFWTTIKRLYQDELKTLYNNLRGNGLTYSAVKARFDEHQGKWPEAIFNEDSQFKYLDPLISSNNASYLTMLQGSKKSQRDWWLYHRFQYMDSKYNVRDNLENAITVRGYAKNNLTITPYADMYVNVKYGSFPVSTRGVKNTTYTMVCPMEAVNDTETYIYGGNCIKAIGGLPGYKVGWADFTAGAKLQEIVLGSAEPGYTNTKLTHLNLGNLRLLKKLDCRNCTALGTGEQATVDASQCTGITQIYMEGTAVTGIDLPNGGQLETLHLPATITNLTLRNQSKLSDLTVAGYSNISTLWIENTPAVNGGALLDQIAANARIRLIGFDLGTITSTQLKSFMDKLDTFRGLDENGNNMGTAQVSGTCHIASVTGEDMAEFQARYPYITVTYDHLTAYVYYYTEDGSSLLHTETVQDGGNATWTGTSSKSSTAQYNYTFDGWSSAPGGSKWTAAQTAVSANRNLYAHFTASLRYYTVYFYNGSTLLETKTNIPYGGSASYSGNTSSLVDPSGSGMPFTYWSPAPTNITGNTSCYAQYRSPREEVEITDSLTTFLANIENGTAKSRYMVGNYLPITVEGEGTMNIQIAGFDKDPLPGGAGKAPVTMVFKEIFDDSHRMNPFIQSTTGDDRNTVYTIGTGTIGGWEHCEMRSYLQETIWSKLPEELRNAICEVEKTTTAYDTAGNSFQQTVVDKIWIPDYNEVFDSSAPVNYTALFDSSEHRKKYKVGATSSSTWWGRCAYDTTIFRCVSNGGNISGINANTTSGVVPGFCLNP